MLESDNCCYLVDKYFSMYVTLIWITQYLVRVYVFVVSNNKNDTRQKFWGNKYFNRLKFNATAIFNPQY